MPGLTMCVRDSLGVHLEDQAGTHVHTQAWHISNMKVHFNLEVGSDL